MRTIGIRREDKNEWESRCPLTPDHVEQLVQKHGLSIVVEPSDRRIFPDEQFQAAGARLDSDLSGCGVILGVKEIPPEQIQPDTVYVCFAHVIKGQPENMEALETYLEQGATLIDYEPIRDNEGSRLVLFGRHAGYAGMIDGFWALGQRYKGQGLETPFQEVRRAFDYDGVRGAKKALGTSVASAISAGALASLPPQIFGFTGSGNVTQGALEVFETLPYIELSPQQLLSVDPSQLRRDAVYKVSFQRHHRDHFAPYLDQLTVLVNGAYWEEGQPKIAPRSELQRLYSADTPPRLELIADISCDVDGSVEATTHQTTPGEPVYVYNPATGATTPGVKGRGPVVLAVGNLPTELPRDASETFSEALAPFALQLAQASFRVPFEELKISPELSRAVITHLGSLTPAFSYLSETLEALR